VDLLSDDLGRNAGATWNRCPPTGCVTRWRVLNLINASRCTRLLAVTGGDEASEAKPVLRIAFTDIRTCQAARRG
jgi:hypothetical protein